MVSGQVSWELHNARSIRLHSVFMRLLATWLWQHWVETTFPCKAEAAWRFIVKGIQFCSQLSPEGTLKDSHMQKRAAGSLVQHNTQWYGPSNSV